MFVGHTPQWDGLRRYGNVYAADTGAIFAQIPDLSDKPAARLTFGNIAMHTQMLIAPLDRQPVEVRDGPIPAERRFGEPEAEPTLLERDEFVWL